LKTNQHAAKEITSSNKGVVLKLALQKILMALFCRMKLIILLNKNDAKLFHVDDYTCNTKNGRFLGR
jgi:hypothetical protein